MKNILPLLLVLLFIPLTMTAQESETVSRQFDFHYAVAREDLDTVRELLAEEADPNWTPINLLQEEFGVYQYYSMTSLMRQTPLAIAMAAQNKALVEILLQSGGTLTYDRNTLETAIRMNFLDLALEALETQAASGNGILPQEFLGGDYPLVITAAQAGSEELVRFFLKHGEDISVKGKRGDGLLFAAAEGNLPGIIQLCLENGMDRNSSNEWEQTPLARAMMFGNREAMLSLMNQGAEYEPDSLSRLCLYYGLFDITQKIYTDHPDIPYDYVKAFWNALLSGDGDIIEYYRGRVRPEEYLDMNLQGKNILHTAASGGYMPVIRELVESGQFDPFSSSEEAASPAYMAAVWSHNPEAVRYFLDLGWDPNEAAGSMSAASSLLVGYEPTQKADQEILQILVEGGADPDYLMDAISFGKSEALRFLLSTEEGVDSLKPDYDYGRNGARQIDNCMIDMIRAGYETFHGELIDLCTLMLENGADISRDYTGKETLAAMVEKRDYMLFCLLTDYLVLPGIKDAAEQALIHAAGLGRTRFILRLLDVGVSPDIIRDHSSPLGEAVQAGRTDAVTLLLEQGAGPNVRSIDNKLPLELVDENHPEIRDLLIRYGASGPADQPSEAGDLIPAEKAGKLKKSNN